MSGSTIGRRATAKVSQGATERAFERDPAYQGVSSAGAHGYSKWEQVAGYFDGDGCVSVYLGNFTIAFYLDWGDQYRGQILQLQEFFKSQGITTGTVHKATSSSTWLLRIAQEDSAIKVAEKLYPLCHKKRDELQLLLRYRRDNAITGTEVLECLNHFVTIGKRETHGPPRTVSLPWTYEKGFRLSKLRGGNVRAGKTHVLTDRQIRSIWEHRKLFGLSLRRLARMFGVSHHTIRKVLRDEKPA